MELENVEGRWVVLFERLNVVMEWNLNVFFEENILVIVEFDNID